MEKGRITEIFAGVALILLLILLVFFVTGVYGYSYKSSGTTITNSYNTNSFNAYPSQTAPSAYTTAQKKIVYTKPYIVDRSYPTYKYYYTKDDSRYADTKSYPDRRYLRYDDYGKFKAYPGILGNRVDSYEVYVRNREYAGGYFKTVFYFEDYYGNIDSESTTHYIPAREEKRFVIKDVSPPMYKYRTWWYDVVPLTKTPKKTNYNEDASYNTVYYGNRQPRTYSYRY
ncbi:MAG: hypothetical protein AABW93_00800 [Nanoarchaeota archaeon]